MKRRRSRLAAPSLGASAVATAVLAIAIAACAKPNPPTSAPSRAPRVADEPDAKPLAAQRHYEARLLGSIDAARARAGLPPLRIARCVQGPAERWAARLAAGESLRHQSLTPITRACRARRAGEIVGSTNRSPESLVAAWMASPRHRRTLLGAAFTHVGVGVEQAPSGRWFAVADFVAF